MLYQKSLVVKTGLDQAIDEVLFEMRGYTAESDEFAKMVDQLTKLYALKALDRPEHVSRDTMAIIFGNLVGIVLIVGHERTNIVTSKALAFLLKLRLT